MLVKRVRAAVARRWPVRQRIAVVRFRHGEIGPAQARKDRAQAARARAARGASATQVIGEEVLADSVADVATADDVAYDLVSALRSADVAHVRLAPVSGPPIVAIDRDALPALAQALAALPQPSTWRAGMRTSGTTRWTTAQRAARGLDAELTSIDLRRSYVTRAGARVDVAGRSEVTLEVWDRMAGGEPRADGEPHRPGSRVPRSTRARVPYLVEQHWEALAAGAPVAAPVTTRPHAFDVTEPIDVVYTWVDGDDPRWAERKARATGASVAAVNRTADSASRFTSRDELRYSLRSLELYAPWVRHIYVVTDRQRPSWLREDHPRLTLVDHRDIFADPDVLPVYNSHAIESQLHHIEGLSDRYLYLNDDVFFGRVVPKERFFEANGLARFFLSGATLDIGPVSAQDLPVLSAAKRNAALLADELGVAVTHKFKHTPHPQVRAVLEEMEQRFPEIFARVASSRIRHPDDNSIASSLHHYYAYATGRAVPGGIRYAYVNMSDAPAELALRRLLRRRDRDVFCLNDTYADEVGHRQVDRLMRWFLEAYFPLPSSFERLGG